MVSRHVCGNNLDVSKECSWTLFRKTLKQAELVGTELQVGLLDQFIDGLTITAALLRACTQHNGCNEPVEAMHKLLPTVGIRPCRAQAH
jgi:hypothetical protein